MNRPAGHTLSGIVTPNASPQPGILAFTIRRLSFPVNAPELGGNGATALIVSMSQSAALNWIPLTRPMSYSGVQAEPMAVQCPAVVDERSLVERLAAGEPAAIGEVYSAHHRAVHAFAWRLIGDPALAEDLVHDVFVALPKAAARFRGDSSLRTFLTSIAINHARHHVRSASRRRAAMNRLGQEPDDVGQTPEGDARQTELARALTLAMDELSIEHRVTFVLSEVEDRSSKEVAEILGIPDATVRTRLHHAKKRLWDSLERGGFR